MTHCGRMWPQYIYKECHRPELMDWGKHEKVHIPVPVPAFSSSLQLVEDSGRVLPLWA